MQGKESVADLGVPRVSRGQDVLIFVRKKRTKSGSVSGQVIDKTRGYCVIETVGAARDPEFLSRGQRK